MPAGRPPVAHLCCPALQCVLCRYSEENLAYRDICDMWWDAFEGKMAGKCKG